MTIRYHMISEGQLVTMTLQRKRDLIRQVTSLKSFN